MFYQKLKFYSTLGNKLKRLDATKFPEKFIEDESYSYLDNNGQKIKIKYEIERERRLFSEFIHNISNYQKLEERKRNNYFSRLRGYRDIYEEKKIAEQRKKRVQEIIDFKRKREKLYGNKILISYSELQNNIKNYLLEERNKNLNRTTKENIFRNNDEIYKNKLQKFNNKKFLSLNSSVNSDRFDSSGKKLKFLEINNSNIMTNIIRKKLHSNRSNNNLFGKKRQMSLFRLKLKKNEAFSEINPLILSQKETNNIKISSNENNSFININLSGNLDNKKTLSNSSKIKNIKYSINKYSFNQNNIQLNGVKIEWKKRLKSKKPLQLEKIKDKTNISFNNNETSKINSEIQNNDIPYSTINNINKQLLENNKRPMQLKKLNSIKSKKNIK